MALIEQIQKEIAQAMKAKEALRLNVLRGLKTSLKNKEIEKMRPLNESEEIQVVQTLVKQRKESIDQFAKGGRTDLVDQETAELKIIESYLPAAVADEDMQKTVDETIEELQASTAKDMGRVMKAVMAKFAGQVVDGKRVNELVKARLGG